MDFDNFNNHLQYVENNGFTFNMDEKLRLSLAVKELKQDIKVKNVKILGKICGKC